MSQSPSPATPDLSPRPSVDSPAAQAALAAAAAAGADVKVMSKLGKWGAYAARGSAVAPSRLIPVRASWVGLDRERGVV